MDEGNGLEVMIREATESDLDGVIDAFEVVAGEEIHIGTELPIDRDDMKTRLLENHLRRDNATLFVAESDRRIVGTLSSQVHNGVADLGMLIVPGFRGRGIGSRLMDRLIQWCRAMGCHKITLGVWPHNKAAIGLYEKFGFEREGYRRRHWKRKNGEIWDVVLMGLVLDTEDLSSP